DGAVTHQPRSEHAEAKAPTATARRRAFMNCTHARKLFAAFWDDETTQAEREWLEGHFTSCDACRHDYEQYARTLEVLGSLPRVEPSPELHERVLQRVRRAESVPDRMPAA